VPSILRFDEQARRGLERGMETMASAVRVTLGPRGRNVVLEKKYSRPVVTNDGVTIARDIIPLADPFEDMGARMLREVATKTNDVAGDGTTTATVLARAFLREGLRNVAAGANPLALKRGIDVAARAAVASLEEQSSEIHGREDMAHVAAISANDPEIGDMIAEALDHVGADGVVTVEESKKSVGLELEFVDGMQLEKGYLSAQFVTDQERQVAELDEPYILLHDKKVSAVADLLPVLEKVVESGKPLLVVAEDVEGEALATLTVNKVRGTFSVCAVKAPAFGERRRQVLEDVAILTGGQVAAAELGVKLENVTLDMLGRARKVIVTKDDCTIVEGAGDADAISRRMDAIRRDVAEVSTGWEREKLEQRLSRLAGGVGVIRAGAATEVELKERKARIEDAVAATKAAVEEGVVAGGGTALLRARAAVEELDLDGDEAVGAAIVRRGLGEPLWWIARNAGLDAPVVVRDVERDTTGTTGLNATTGAFEDLVAAGIIDPTKVTRAALEHAASVVGMLLTTEALVAAKPEPEAPVHVPDPAAGMGAGMGMGGGMGMGHRH